MHSGRRFPAVGGGTGTTLANDSDCEEHQPAQDQKAPRGPKQIVVPDLGLDHGTLLVGVGPRCVQTSRIRLPSRRRERRELEPVTRGLGVTDDDFWHAHRDQEESRQEDWSAEQGADALPSRHDGIFEWRLIGVKRRLDAPDPHG